MGTDGGVHTMQRRTIRTAIGLVAVLGSLSWTGCENPDGGARGTQALVQGPPVTPVQHQMLENLPLPAGFYMVPERSVARSAGAVRVAQCEFQGGSNPDAIARFYLEYMPTARYALRYKRFDNGEYTLRFENETEECNVRIRSGKGKTVLLIDVGPRATEAEERVSATPPSSLPERVRH